MIKLKQDSDVITISEEVICKSLWMSEKLSFKHYFCITLIFDRRLHRQSVVFEHPFNIITNDRDLFQWCWWSVHPSRTFFLLFLSVICMVSSETFQYTVTRFVHHQTSINLWFMPSFDIPGTWCMVTNLLLFYYILRLKLL